MAQVARNTTTLIKGAATLLQAGDWVSSISRFEEPMWRLDVTTAGQGMVSINWNFDLPGGGRFGDSSWSVLRTVMKQFFWSLLCDRRVGLSLSAGSAGKVALGIRILVRWMVANDYQAIDELDSQASEDFLDDCVLDLTTDRDRTHTEEAGSDDDENGIGLGALRPRTNVWALLWQQTSFFREAGIAPLPEVPFGGRPARSVAERMANGIEGWIPPVPDEVALPIMEAAEKWIGRRADDVIELQRLYLAEVDRSEGLCPDHCGIRTKKILEDFTFSSEEGAERGWRSSLVPEKRYREYSCEWGFADHDVHSVFRTLIEDVCSACVITLQSEAGQRISEICGLKAGRNPKTGLPMCVSIRLSKSGLNEHFILSGLLFKTCRTPTEVEWLIGSRPVGSAVLPSAVRALQVLDQLLEPLRRRAVDRSIAGNLIVKMTAPRGYPRDGTMIGKMSSPVLLRMQRTFIANHVNLTTLPDRSQQGEDLALYRASRGTRLRSHSWRKSFALYVFRTDPRMVDAIAQQFHHLSLAMTEEGYIGTDAALLQCMDGARLQQTVLFFHDMATGRRRVAGRLAKIIEQYKQEFSEYLAGADASVDRESVHRWVLKEDIRIWFSKHGKCFIGMSPRKAKCHEKAGTSHWAHKVPNYEARSPEVCLGCPLYAVDHEHSEFWIRRFSENVLHAASCDGAVATKRISERRARQSSNVLRVLGVAVPVVPQARTLSMEYASG